ncbi:MAG: hypothetical protein JWP06_666 [Candidatus Saccharibacteria bacterium]|nr:hypothetical protein [Candidatus Saccharibacteria bacterium]
MTLNSKINSYTAQLKKGEKLLPLLIDMTLWGLEHDPESLASSEFIERIRSDEVKVKRETHRAIKLGRFSVYRREKMGIDPK